MNIIIKELEPVAVCKQQIEQKPTKTQEIQELSTTIDNFFNQLSSSIPETTSSSKPETTSSSKPETTSSSSPVILNIIKGAKLDEIIYDPPLKSKSYILYIGTKAGGNNRITRNFFTGTKLRSNGGVIFYYNLIDSNGIIKLSGVESFYTKFQSVPTGSVKDF